MKKIKVIHVLIGVSVVIWVLFWYAYKTQVEDNKELNQNTQKHVKGSEKEGKDDAADKHHNDEE
ncbi:hypothetical protein [Bacillus thuringiensis]|uniref:hypothetical protein n=1 Tax=Bacillus thuringiensis TaxID=1428 RepID=UPI0021D662DB|nr:hypothetical protein [Bacillus thuringiensis]MCU7667291.1 hypothetical protein [Bacillus thuringiensis]